MIRVFIFAAITTLSFCGCSPIHSVSSRKAYRYIQPTVAVFKFDNKAGSPMKWDLGNGMTDMMVTKLMETKRFTVVERADLNAILKELDLQQKGITRAEGKVPRKRIINVRYLIKGVITDFSHTGRNGMGIGVKSAKVSTFGNTALVSMVISAIDVESGEILLSTTVDSKVRGRGFNVKASYENVSFGGYTFSRTPLGKATGKAMGDAIKQIVGVIGSEIWRPSIIEIDNEKTMLSGGKDRHIKTGDMYHIFKPGTEIYDPDTGNLLGTTPGEKIGVVEIKEVFDKFSRSVLKEGRAGKVGMHLEKLRGKEISEFNKRNHSGD